MTKTTAAKKPFLGRGTYGTVRSCPITGHAMKKTKIWRNTELDGNNFNEAVVSNTLKRLNLPYFVGVDSVKLDGNDITIKMECGAMSLHDYIYNTPYYERMKHLKPIVTMIATALHHLHSHGMAHLDLKCDNIIVVERDGKLEIRLIDFGSVRLIGSDTEILCTYVYCAPEALKHNAMPTAACDAFSLGCIIYNFIYKDYLYDFTKYTTREEIIRMYETEGIELPTFCPNGVDMDVFNAMMELLNLDACYRLPIKKLYINLNDTIEIVESPTITVELTTPTSQWPRRSSDIQWMYDGYDCKYSLDVLSLAVLLLDRFVAKTGVTPREEHLKAAFAISRSILYPDYIRVSNSHTRDAFVEITSALNFDLASDTAESILVKEHGIRSDEICPKKLVAALQGSGGSTFKAVHLYLGGGGVAPPRRQ